jgi:hypothetical protein
MRVFGVEKLERSADLTIVIAGVRVDGMVTVAVAVTRGPLGGVPDAVAVFVTPPASTSACVVAYVAVQDSSWAGASVSVGQLTDERPGSKSVTLTEVSVTLPVFVTI